MDRFIYIVPVTADNHEGYSWCKVGQFWVFPCDENGAYDGEMFGTRAEAEQYGTEVAADMGWDTYQISWDE